VLSHRLPSQLIDFHVHLFPDQLFDAIWKFFETVYQWPILYPFYYQQCIAYLRQNSVKQIVYSNYAHKKGVAAYLNNWNLDVLKNNEDLYCFAAFHPDDENGLEMAARVLKHPRVLGFKLQLLVQNFYPADERLFPLYELVIEKNKRILFHVGTGPTGNSFVGYNNFLPLIRRYPDLPANIAHLGGFEFKQFFDLLQDYPKLMMDTAFCFFPKLNMVFDLPSEYLENHADRILYGSDFPNLLFPREEEIEALVSFGLSDRFYQDVFHNNAKRLLDIHCPLA